MITKLKHVKLLILATIPQETQMFGEYRKANKLRYELFVAYLCLFLVCSVSQAETCGIYALDNRQGTSYGKGSLREKRFEKVKNINFVTGYAWRQNWSFFELNQGMYDFYPLDFILDKVSTQNKKLGILLKTKEPEYVVQNAQNTWEYINNNDSFVRPVPWDEYSTERYKHFIEKFANHEINGTKLSDHPTLAYLTVEIPGLGWIRKRNKPLNNIPGYSREKFINTVIQSLGIVVANFPHKTIATGIWRVKDSNRSPELWEELRTKIISEFGGDVGFFMENLAAEKDDLGEVTGYPNINFASTLFLSRDDVPIYFQALTSWRRPFTGADKVKGGLPIDGIKYAQDTFNAKYFEIYVHDLIHESYITGLKDWVNENC